MNAEVTTIEHTDVKGKKMLYLKITVGYNDVFINVGEKTIQSVNALFKQTQITTEKVKEEPENKNKNKKQ